MMKLNTSCGWRRPVRQIVMGEVQLRPNEDFIPAILLMGEPLGIEGGNDRLIMAIERASGINFWKINDYHAFTDEVFTIPPQTVAQTDLSL